MFFLFLTACDGEADVSTYAPEEQNIEIDGELVYLNQCASCHGENGQLGVSNSSDLSVTTLSEEEMFKVITKGQGQMPPFEYLISEEERKAVIQHVKSLKE